VPPGSAGNRWSSRRGHQRRHHQYKSISGALIHTGTTIPADQTNLEVWGCLRFADGNLGRRSLTEDVPTARCAAFGSAILPNTFEVSPQLGWLMARSSWPRATCVLSTCLACAARPFCDAAFWLAVKCSGSGDRGSAQWNTDGAFEFRLRAESRCARRLRNGALTLSALVDSVDAVHALS
jgi:hypothetical protein